MSSRAWLYANVDQFQLSYLGRGKENEEHGPDYLKWLKTRYYQNSEDSNNLLFYSYARGNHA